MRSNTAIAADAVVHAQLAREVVLVGGATHDWCAQSPGGLVRLREHLAIVGHRLGLDTLWYRRGSGCQVVSVGDDVATDRWSHRRPIVDEIGELLGLAMVPDARLLIVIDGIEHLVGTGDGFGPDVAIDVLDLLQQFAVDSGYIAGDCVVALIEHNQTADVRLRDAPGVVTVELPMPSMDEREEFVVEVAMSSGTEQPDRALVASIARAGAGLRLDEIYAGMMDESVGGLVLAATSVTRARLGVLARLGIAQHDPTAEGSDVPAISIDIGRRQIELALCGDGPAPLLVASADHSPDATGLAAAMARSFGRPILTIDHPLGLDGLDSTAFRRIAPMQPSIIEIVRPLRVSRTSLLTLRALRSLGGVVVGSVARASQAAALGATLLA